MFCTASAFIPLLLGITFLRKSLKAAKKAHEKHMGDIKELEDELEAVERKRQDYEERLEEESQSQGKDMTLETSQVLTFAL